MTDRSAPRLRLRGRSGVIVVLGVTLIVLMAVGARYGPQLLRRDEVNDVATSAADALRAAPGVASADVTVDHRLRSPRRELSDRIGDSRRPRGEVTLDAVVSEDIAPDELAEALTRARSALDDPTLARHAISIRLTQRGSDRRIFDGWGVAIPATSRTGAQTLEIAALALDLPDGAWLDLDPATFEQGQFNSAGPPPFHELLGQDVHGGFTIGARLQAETTSAFLDEALRLTATAAESLDGPTALQLLGPRDAVVLTATQPDDIGAALRAITERIGELTDPDALTLSYEAGLDWAIDDGASRGIPTVRLTLDTGRCAPDDEHTALVDDLERILDERSVRGTVETAGCTG